MFDHHSKLISFFGELEYGVDTHKDAVIISPGTTESVCWLKFRNKNDCIYIRPVANKAPYFLLLDDMSAAAAQAHRSKPGRLIIETSSGNYQVWVKFDQPLDYESKKALAIEAGAVPDAHPTTSRWRRASGLLNRKPNPKTRNTDGSHFRSRFVAVSLNCS